MLCNTVSRSRIQFLLAVVLLMAAVVMGQDVGAPPSAKSARVPVKQQFEQLLQVLAQTPAATEALSSPALFDPRSRDNAPQTSPQQPVRLPGAPTAAERYVFGRMDLATGTYPNGVATGAFQTGGPQSIAVANSG